MKGGGGGDCCILLPALEPLAAAPAIAPNVTGIVPTVAPPVATTVVPPIRKTAPPGERVLNRVGHVITVRVT